jgi:DeoR family transcriptional regulator, aga operon transcriptional repressor
VALRYSSANERRSRLLAIVEEQGFCTIAELSLALDVSEMTVRRDVRRLADDGRLRSVHGGVSVLPQQALLGSDFTSRAQQMADAKRAIAKSAVTTLSDGGTIAIDAGTTALELARAVPADRKLTVVTHSVPVIMTLLSHPRVEVVALGGVLHSDTQSFAGPATLEALEGLRVSTFFLAASGISARGVYCGNDFDALTKRALIGVADRVVLIADSSKFTASAMVRVCPLSTVDVAIVDSEVDSTQRKLLTSNGVRVVIAGSSGSARSRTGSA